jgi:hypothetical protein
MKKTLIAVAVGLSFVGGVYAQGTVDFRNKNAGLTPPFDVPIYDVDGTTKLSGANFLAQIYFSATQNGSFAPITDPAAPFRTGGGAGYWNYGTDFTRVLTGIAAGTAAWIQVRVWDSTAGATPDAAKLGGGKWGDSNIFSVTTGGSGNPPAVPATLIGMTSFQLQQVPEPSTIALGVLGLGALLLRRRK